jgi:hypothetical protein
MHLHFVTKQHGHFACPEWQKACFDGAGTGFLLPL